MTTTQHPIGILGGTFDPIHNGHLHIAQTLLKTIPLDHIRFIPCKMPVHKDNPSTSVNDRVQMITLAIETQQKFILDRREIDRNSASYMITTLQSLQQSFPQRSLCLILGLDVYLNLATWKDWQSILKFCHIIITHRANFNLKNQAEMTQYYFQHKTDKPSDLIEQKAGLIYFPPMKPSPISATQLRQEMHAGKQPTNEIPKAVADYIKAKRLYTHCG